MPPRGGRGARLVEERLEPPPVLAGTRFSGKRAPHACCSSIQRLREKAGWRSAVGVAAALQPASRQEDEGQGEQRRELSHRHQCNRLRGVVRCSPHGSEEDGPRRRARAAVPPAAGRVHGRPQRPRQAAPQARRQGRTRSRSARWPSPRRRPGRSTLLFEREGERMEALLAAGKRARAGQQAGGLRARRGGPAREPRGGAPPDRRAAPPGGRPPRRVRPSRSAATVIERIGTDLQALALSPAAAGGGRPPLARPRPRSPRLRGARRARSSPALRSSTSPPAGAAGGEDGGKRREAEPERKLHSEARTSVLREARPDAERRRRSASGRRPSSGPAASARRSGAAAGSRWRRRRSSAPGTRRTRCARRRRPGREGGVRGPPPRRGRRAGRPEGAREGRARRRAAGARRGRAEGGEGGAMEHGDPHADPPTRRGDPRRRSLSAAGPRPRPLAPGAGGRRLPPRPRRLHAQPDRRLPRGRAGGPRHAAPAGLLPRRAAARTIPCSPRPPGRSSPTSIRTARQRNAAVERGDGAGDRSPGPADRAYDLSLYLRHVVRELPGDDMEFGFPARTRRTPERGRRTAPWPAFLAEGAPFHLHASFHGMGFASGPWFLIEEAWIDRTAALRDAIRRRVRAMGYQPFDVDRGGEKGFHRIDEGFTTRPDSRSMVRWFEERGTIPRWPRSSAPARWSTSARWAAIPSPWSRRCRSSCAPWKQGRPAGRTIPVSAPSSPGWPASAPEEVRAEMERGGVRGMPIRDQMRLQLAFLNAALESASAAFWPPKAKDSETA